MKVVINKDYGGFGLSSEACKYLYDLLAQDPVANAEYLKKTSIEYGFVGDIPRNLSQLVETVEHFGCDKASGKYSRLEIVDIPDDIEWEIEDDDGYETIHEAHRSW